MSENILEVKGLTKDYGDFVLDKLTFTVPKGVIMGLIGENGAGKSTTINCILNEISKTDGNIEIFGKDYLSEEIEIKDKIGVVFDENHFPDIFTPNEIGTYMSGIYSKWERNTYVNYLSKFELPADKRVKDFSKGMKVKLAILYVNHQLGFSMEMPLNWMGQVEVEEEYGLHHQNGGNCITFYHKPTHDNGEGGILFFIDCYPGEWSEDNPPVIAGHSVVVAQTENYSIKCLIAVFDREKCTDDVVFMNIKGTPLL